MNDSEKDKYIQKLEQHLYELLNAAGSPQGLAGYFPWSIDIDRAREIYKEMEPLLLNGPSKTNESAN